MSSIAERSAEIILEEQIGGFSPDKPVEWKSGGLHPFYVNCREILSLPRARSDIVSLYMAKIAQLQAEDPQFKFQGLAGVVTAGLAYGALLVDQLTLPLVGVQTVAKTHGTGSAVAGRIAEGTTYLGIEDVFSTGGSTIDSLNNLRAEAHTEFPNDTHEVVTHAMAIMSYDWSSTRAKFAEAQIKPVSLTTFPDLLRVGIKSGMVNKRMEKSLKDWYEDPHGWAARQNKTA